MLLTLQAFGNAKTLRSNNSSCVQALPGDSVAEAVAVTVTVTVVQLWLVRRWLVDVRDEADPHQYAKEEAKLFIVEIKRLKPVQHLTRHRAFISSFSLSHLCLLSSILILTLPPF